MPKFIDLKGKTFGSWVVKEYIGKSVWRCVDTETGLTKDIHSYDLRNKYLNNRFEYKPKGIEDLSNRKFNEWTVIKYVGNKTGQWLCRCSCGSIREVSGYDLKNNKSKHCSSSIHKIENLQGQKFGEWVVIEYAGGTKWHCKCSCGTERDLETRVLKDGISKSCGHDRNYHIIHKDITGNTYGNLVVLGYTGNNQMWHCKCACGKEIDVLRDSLISGKTKSCGCLKEQMRKETLLSKYADTNTARINNPRKDWQIKVLESRENLSEYISGIGRKTTAYELSELLDVHDTTILKALRKYNLIDMVEDVRSGESAMEIEICNILDSLGVDYIRRSRKIVNGEELDIYIPEHKIAIEFNGTYWHSDEFKTSKYHQDKTIKCIQNGVHLIHIFEYEWLDMEKRSKISGYLADLLGKSEKVYGRNTKVSFISDVEAKEFLNKYHLQGYSASDINIACIKDGEILGVMTFGSPRFDNQAQYELIRLCWKQGIKVIGGAEKMFKHFLNTYSPKNIISYCDLTKFSGDVYLKLGFKTEASLLTKPNYVWVNPRHNDVLNRYQTQKSQLVKLGLGDFSETEDDIMSRLGYLKIYNSGNLKFIYNSK